MALLFSACRETDGESSLAYLTTLGSAVKLYYRLAKILWIGIGRVNVCGLDHQKYIGHEGAFLTIYVFTYQ